MKKSEIYRMVQVAILDNDKIAETFKLEILRELFAQEDLAKFSEAQEVKQQEAVEG